MIEIGWYSVKLFLKGKLIRDPLHFLQQTLIAVTVGLLIFVLLAQAAIPLCIPVTLSSLATGLMMPFLLKDFKMK